MGTTRSSAGACTMAGNFVASMISTNQLDRVDVNITKMKLHGRRNCYLLTSAKIWELLWKSCGPRVTDPEWWNQAVLVTGLDLQDSVNRWKLSACSVDSLGPAALSSLDTELTGNGHTGLVQPKRFLSNPVYLENIQSLEQLRSLWIRFSKDTALGSVNKLTHISFFSVSIQVHEQSYLIECLFALNDAVITDDFISIKKKTLNKN